MKRLNGGLLLALFLLSFCLLPSQQCTAESYYKLTEEEMQILETSLSRLSSNLEKSNKEFLELKKESIELKKELQTLRITVKSQQTLLDDANKLLEIQRQEEKRRSKILKAQRTVWQIVAIGGLYFAIRK